MHQTIILLIFTIFLFSCSDGNQSAAHVELSSHTQQSQISSNYEALRASVEKLKSSDNADRQLVLTEVRDSLENIFDSEDEEFTKGSDENIQSGIVRLNEVLSILRSISSTNPQDYNFIFGYNLELFSEAHFDQMLSALELDNRKSNLASDYVLMQFLRKQIDDQLFALPSFNKKNIIRYFSKRLVHYQRDVDYQGYENRVIAAFYPLLELDGAQYDEELYIRLFSLINKIKYSEGLAGLAKASYHKMLAFLNTRNFKPTHWSKLESFSYQFMSSLNTLLEIKINAYKANPADINRLDEIDQIMTVLDAPGAEVGQIDLKTYFELRTNVYFLLEGLSKIIAENKTFLELNQKNCALNLAIYKARVLSKMSHAKSFSCIQSVQAGNTSWDKVRHAFIKSEELKLQFAANQSIDQDAYEQLKKMTIDTLGLVDESYLDFKLKSIYKENFSNLQDIDRLKKLNDEVVFIDGNMASLSLGASGVDYHVEAGIYYYDTDLVLELSGNVTFHPFALVLAPGRNVQVKNGDNSTILSNLWIDVTGVQSLQRESKNYDRYFSLPNPVSKQSSSRWVIDWHGVQNELMNPPLQNEGIRGGDGGAISFEGVSLRGNTILMAKGGKGGEGAIEQNGRLQRPAVVGLQRTTDRCETSKGDRDYFPYLESRFKDDGIIISPISFSQGQDGDEIVVYCFDEFITITFPEIKKGSAGLGGRGGKIYLEEQQRALYSSININQQNGESWSEQ